jgi:hypothetical protein
MTADDIHRIAVRSTIGGASGREARVEASNLETYTVRCQFEIEKFLT